MNINTKGLKAWAVVNASTGALRMRAPNASLDDWQAKIYSSKKSALKFAWSDEIVIAVSIIDRPGKQQKGS